MVVADTSGGDQKSLITYEVAQEAMLAYAQAHNQSVNSAANVEIVGLQTADSFTHNEHQEHIENNIPVSQAITIAQRYVFYSVAVCKEAVCHENADVILKHLH